MGDPEANRLMVDRKRPDWVRQGLVIAGNWEPLMFRRRSGLAGSDEADLYERQHSEETFQKMADLGVNLVMLHFDKGTALAELAEEIERTRKSAELCHQIGMRVGA